MIEFINSQWVSSIILLFAGVVLSAILGIVQPKINKNWSETSQRRRERAIQKRVEQFRAMLVAYKTNSLIFTHLRYWGFSLLFFVMALFCGTVFLIMRIPVTSKPCEGIACTTPTIEIVFFTVIFACCMISIYRGIQCLNTANEIERFALSPDIHKEDLIKFAKDLDKDFDEAILELRI